MKASFQPWSENAKTTGAFATVALFHGRGEKILTSEIR
jgi:hypothetical protein